MGIGRRRLRDFAELSHVKRPALARNTPHDVARIRVAPVRRIEIAHNRAEHRQHVVPAPAVRAHALPFGKVAGQPRDGEHAHHARAAAHHARLQIGRRRVALAQAALQVWPEVVAVEIGCREAVANVIRRCVRRRVLPGFDQQHAARAVFRQPGCENGAGGATSDDDDVRFTHHESASELEEGNMPASAALASGPGCQNGAGSLALHHTGTTQSPRQTESRPSTAQHSTGSRWLRMDEAPLMALSSSSVLSPIGGLASAARLRRSAGPAATSVMQLLASRGPNLPTMCARSSVRR